MKEKLNRINVKQNSSIYKIDVVETEKVPQKKEFKKQKPTKLLKERISAIIDKLLYSRIRKAINERQTVTNNKTYLKAVSRYIQNKISTNECVIVSEIMQIHSHYKNNEYLLSILKYDELTILKYTNIILKVYKIIFVHSPTSIKIEELVLGVLYEMRQGYQIAGVQIFKADWFLLHHLPQINNITMFGYDKKTITKGKQKIEIVYKKAIKKGLITL